MKTTRRTFLASAAAAGTVAAITHRDAVADETSPLKIGVIGVGWYGMVDAKAALKVGGVEIVAICDVDRDHLTKSADELEKLQGKRPAEYKLYEEMLEKAELDAMIIGTPPHWHALQLQAALDYGLNVYCEKPLSYDVREGRAMVDAVAASGQVVQIGFQRRQSKAFQQVKEYIESGKAGRIVQAEVQIHYNAGTGDATPQDPPTSLDWDLWCGPAPKIPYSPQVGHKKWRLEKTTGHGHMVDWGIHNLDATRMMLGLSMPKQINASGGLYQYAGSITTPDTMTVNFEFDELPVVWRHRLWGATEYDADTTNGVFLYGEKATIFVADQRWVVIPKGKSAPREVNEVKSDMGTLQMANFLAAVRGEEELACPIIEAFKSTAMVQLGMIAYESNSVVRWDEASEQIVNNEAAAKLLKREYREPWKHPHVTS
ncbi:Gfo/Idh/MocA family protein [Novipirellula artificiosorum]|uniref:Inositol 2-dehydrogenase n=1 Tax=Novipirellula artificiosorum TaxID=2528016 RepID=A0A5C6DH19_9BACT|nr:Gfo/Idh/MocA family oxidoreductase [Novipirellula artificiosorum]TWU34336.1 Inositol 2-dehydrogenase [Novipirellula artificiosorum]